MTKLVLSALTFALMTSTSLACREAARLPISSGQGPTPILPDPVKSLIPTTEVAPAHGWDQGARPTSTSGAKVTAFATQLQHPRWVYVLPNQDDKSGDLLVADDVGDTVWHVSAAPVSAVRD